MTRPVSRQASALALLAAAGCHGGAPVDTATSRRERTVFTDSAMHARLCQPNAPGLPAPAAFHAWSAVNLARPARDAAG